MYPRVSYSFSKVYAIAITLMGVIAVCASVVFSLFKNEQFHIFWILLPLAGTVYAIANFLMPALKERAQLIFDENGITFYEERQSRFIPWTNIESIESRVQLSKEDEAFGRIMTIALKDAGGNEELIERSHFEGYHLAILISYLSTNGKEIVAKANEYLVHNRNNYLGKA